MINCKTLHAPQIIVQSDVGHVGVQGNGYVGGIRQFVEVYVLEIRPLATDRRRLKENFSQMAVGALEDTALIAPRRQAQDSAGLDCIGLQIGFIDRPARPSGVIAFVEIERVEWIAHAAPMITGTAQESEATGVEIEVVSSNDRSVVDVLGLGFGLQSSRLQEQDRHPPSREINCERDTGNAASSNADVVPSGRRRSDEITRIHDHCYVGALSGRPKTRWYVRPLNDPVVEHHDIVTAVRVRRGRAVSKYDRKQNGQG